MVTKLKTFAIAALAVVTLGATVAATATPAQAFIGFPRYAGYYYAPGYYGPGVGYAAGAVIGNAIAAGSYPYYSDPYADPYGYGPYGAPYQYPYPGYGYYYGY